MEQYRPYPCRQCGSCCKRVDLIESMRVYNRGDGVCKNLRADNKCGIYEQRPDICNGQYVYEHFYSHLTVDEFHKIIKEYCEKMRRGDFEGFYQNQQGD